MNQQPGAPGQAAPAPDIDAQGAALAEYTNTAQIEQEKREREAAEEKEVGEWIDRITNARTFDANARKQYAIDRRYVNGEAAAAYEVSVNIAGTYVGILESFLYARDPSVDSQPSRAVGPSGQEEARQFGKTLEITLDQLWDRARLKQAAKPMVRSALSVGIGWIKIVFLKRTERDPLIEKRIADMQDNLRRVSQLALSVEAGTSENPAADRLEIERQIKGLEAQVEVVKSMGLAIDYVSAEDIQVAPECPTLEQYADSPWIAHRMFFPVCRAKEVAPLLTDEQLKSATKYRQRKPLPPLSAERDRQDQQVDEKDADAFHVVGEGDESKGSICVWEVWDRDAMVIRTYVEGVRRWARDVGPPNVKTSRFFPFFQWAPVMTDGLRHPQSLVSRSIPLLNEYHKIRSAYAEHRRRALPKIGFDRGVVEKGDAEKMEKGAIGEMVGVDLKGAPANAVMWPIPYNPVDMSLYDTGIIRSELELTWGIQEALSSSIRTAKTATEAEIQQGGSESRQGLSRDSLDEMFRDMAIYSAEIAISCLSLEDVQKYAGPEAFWPVEIAATGQRMTLEQMAILVRLDIRAGSSGRAATVIRQERWAQTLPILKEAIGQIAADRMSSPEDRANAIEQLVVETLDRAGENIDPARFIPKMGKPIPLLDPNSGQPVMAYLAPGQQMPQPKPPAAPAGPTAPPPGMPAGLPPT